MLLLSAVSSSITNSFYISNVCFNSDVNLNAIKTTGRDGTVLLLIFFLNTWTTDYKFLTDLLFSFDLYLPK